MKDSFKLTKNSWHAKLMYYIWDLRPSTFTHMCPYFWLSVFNVLIIPVVLIGKGFKYIFESISDFFENIAEAGREKREAYWFKLGHDIETNPDLLDKIASYCDKKYDRIIRSIRYRGNYPISEELDDLIRQRRRLYRITQRAREDSAKDQLIADKARMNAILKKVEPVLMGGLYVIMSAIFAGLLYLIYKGIMYIITHPAKIRWFDLLCAVGFFMGVVIVIAIIGFSIRALFIWAQDKTFFSFCKTNKIIKAIIRPFRWLGNGISTIIEMIYSLYKNNCPPIDWE